MPCQLIKTAPSNFQDIMNKDAMLLDTLDKDGPVIVHFYRANSPALSIGCFLQPDKVLNLEALQHHKILAAKRPTGGGVIFHLTDLAFSILIPASHRLFSQNTLTNYATINEAVIEAILSMVPNLPKLLQDDPVPINASCRHFCMAKPTQYDVMIGDKKIAGAAQRRTKAGLLHQSSIQIAMPPKNILQDVLLSADSVLSAMQHYTATLFPHIPDADELEKKRQNLEEALYASFKNCFGKEEC